MSFSSLFLRRWAGGRLKLLRVSDQYSHVSTRQKLHKRPFSSPATTAKPLSTEQKAAEVQKEMWPRVKKYLFLIVPSVFGTVLSILVISAPSVRYAVEESFPSYVQFLRDYYGFDEDFEEVKRIRNTNAANDETVVDVVATLSDGNKYTLPNVKGSLSHQQLEGEIQRNLSGNFSILRIDIRESTNSGTSPNEESACSATDISTESSLIPAVYSGWEDSALNSSVGTSAKYSSSSPNSITKVDIGIDFLKTNNIEYSRDQLANLGPIYQFANINRLFVDSLQEFRDYMSRSQSGSSKYKVSSMKPMVLEEMQANSKPNRSSSSQAESQTLLLQQQKQQQSSSSTGSNYAQEKERAAEKIESLKQQIAFLEYQKLIGTRDIDSIQADIELVNKEIAAVNKKYFKSWFGF